MATVKIGRVEGPSWLSTYENAKQKPAVKRDALGRGCDGVDAPKLHSKRKGKKHVYVDFQEWKEYENVDRGEHDEEPRWYPAFTRRTRVAPDREWSAAALPFKANHWHLRQFHPLWTPHSIMRNLL